MSLFGKAWQLGRKVRLATYLIALWKLVRHRETPRAAKWVAWSVLAYALSPIDLVPDFIPVLGQLDDIILIPLGVALVVKMVPATLWQRCLDEAESHAGRLPRLWWGALLIALVWLAVLGLLGWAAYTAFFAS
ncbi:YkvA family protein [Ideonella sp. DXS29W]|uniref:YkvA family protein n=1 Tax=Ideonella lacteola TaxID=2984193 RepID=A0ABU9BJV8_9BURK